MATRLIGLDRDKGVWGAFASMLPRSDGSFITSFPTLKLLQVPETHVVCNGGRSAWLDFSQSFLASSRAGYDADGACHAQLLASDKTLALRGCSARLLATYN